MNKSTARMCRHSSKRDIVTRYGPVLGWITADNGSEMKQLVAGYLETGNPGGQCSPVPPTSEWNDVERSQHPVVEACI